MNLLVHLVIYGHSWCLKVVWHADRTEVAIVPFEKKHLLNYFCNLLYLKLWSENIFKTRFFSSEKYKPSFLSIDSFRLFVHRVSSHHHLYHRQNVDLMCPSSRSKEPIGEVKIKLCASLASQRIHFTSQGQVLKDSRDHTRDRKQRRLVWSLVC